MRRLILIGAIAAVAFACGTGADMLGEMLDAGVPDAGAEMPGDGTSMRYVGNSAKTFPGARSVLNEFKTAQVLDDNGLPTVTGIYEYYAACQETFGPGHRTCTTSEILYTTRIPEVAGIAWVGPGADCAPNSEYPFWTDNSARRSVVTSTGALQRVECFVGFLPGERSAPPPDRELPVACCGPK